MKKVLNYVKSFMKMIEADGLIQPLENKIISIWLSRNCWNFFLTIRREFPLIHIERLMKLFKQLH